MSHSFSLSNTPEPALTKLLSDGLNSHAADVGYPSQWVDLSVIARDEAGDIVAGLSGNTGQGLFYTRLLWVREDQRRTGLGRKLLELGEAEAIKRGCHTAALDTYSFQGPDYYPKLGYIEYGRMEGMGHNRDLTRIWFMKRIA